MNHILKNKNIIIALTGGIACYKIAELTRLLIKAGAKVQIIMTKAACQFITPITMQALSNNPVYISQWDNREQNNMPHINLTRNADLLIIAPASADIIAKIATGQSSGLISLTALARPQNLPLLIAPAMNLQMWQHPATKRNIEQIKKDGAQVLEVGCGAQACGEEGDGRMLEAQEILEEITSALTPKILNSKKVLITAGPTFEAIDPVRGITNLSSGKMGFAIANAAKNAGAEVTLISGVSDSSSLKIPRGIKRHNIKSAAQMHKISSELAQNADIFISCAAVADWRVKNYSETKIKKDKNSKNNQMPEIIFEENPDILKEIANSKRALDKKLYCVGFAAESDNLEQNAIEKRKRKNVPLLIANIGHKTFGNDENEILIIDETGITAEYKNNKNILAENIIQEIAKRI